MAQISLSLNEMKRDQRRKRALRDAFLTEVSEEELNTIFDIWSRPEVIQLINELGDIENPIPLGMKMLKDVPEFRKYAKKAAMAILWGQYMNKYIQRIRYPPFEYSHMNAEKVPLIEVVVESECALDNEFKIGKKDSWYVEWSNYKQEEKNTKNRM